MISSQAFLLTEMEALLKNLEKWELFAIHLEGINSSHVEVIKRADGTKDKKIALLLKKWFDVCSDPTLEKVIQALDQAEEHSIADHVSMSTSRYSSETTSSVPFSYSYSHEEDEFDENFSKISLIPLSTSPPDPKTSKTEAGYETEVVFDVNGFRIRTQAFNKTVAISVFKSLWTFTGLENSSASISMVLNKAFDFNEAGKKTADNSFLHYEMMAYCKSETTRVLMGTSRSGRYLKNFEITLLRALKLAGIKLSINEYNQDDEAILTKLVYSLQTIQKALGNNKMLESFASGIGLINIWEMGFNRSITPFIESFNGCLTSNSVFLFIDINDVQKLYAPPLSGNRRLKWRSTLQYLIRPCQLSLGSKKNICTVFLMHDSPIQSNKVKNCVETLKEFCTLALDQMGIHDNVDCEIIDVDRQSDCKKVAERARILLQEADVDKIDFSHLFLRCILAHMPESCITHEELHEKAKQFTEMNENDIQTFCKYFTSFGSILDVKQVNSESNYIIIKPLEFLLKLDYLLTQKRVQESNALEIPGLGIDSFSAQHVIAVLIDVHIAVEIPKLTRIQQAPQPKYYFTPSVKFGKDQKFKTQFSKGAIQFVMNPGAPRLNVNIDVIKRLLNRLQKPSLEFTSDDINTIIINTQFGHDQDDRIAISLSYMGDIIEISLEKHGKVTTQQIESTCADVMSCFNESLRLHKKRVNNEKSIKYHFAVLCKKDEFGEGVLYSMYRIRHILPADLCEKCIEEYKERLPIIDTWRRLLQGTNKIDPELILNGDLTVDNICMLAKKLSDFPWSAVVTLANELKAPILQNDPLAGKNRREWVILQMLMQWENCNYGREKDSLRKIMALKLHDAQMQWQEHDPSFRFKRLARNLDIHVLTQAQRRDVLEMITRHVSVSDDNEVESLSKNVRTFS